MENRLEKLCNYRRLSVKLREVLITSLPEERVDDETLLWVTYLQSIDEAVDIAEAYLVKEKENIKSEGSTSDTSTYNKQSNLKLPKLELPKFYGDFLKFQNFWDQYEAAVHNNDNLADVQKFTYLRSVLGGVAYQAIEGFEITGANYTHAVQALKHRYGRKRVIISSLVKSIVKLEAKSNVEAASLRDLHDTLQNRIRALEGLGENPKVHACIYYFQCLR